MKNILSTFWHSVKKIYCNITFSNVRMNGQLHWWKGNHLVFYSLTLKKPLDKVWNDKLIVKLENIDIGGDLLSKFIKNKHQCFKINQTFPFEEWLVGLLMDQDALGPLLFINYLSFQLVSLLSRIELYADNLKLYGDCSSVEKCIYFYEDILIVEDLCNQC